MDQQTQKKKTAADIVAHLLIWTSANNPTETVVRDPDTYLSDHLTCDEAEEFFFRSLFAVAGCELDLRMAVTQIERVGDAVTWLEGATQKGIAGFVIRTPGGKHEGKAMLPTRDLADLICSGLNKEEADETKLFSVGTVNRDGRITFDA